MRLGRGSLLVGAGLLSSFALVASLVAATSFTVVTASAGTSSVQLRQTLKRNLRGARSASASSARQKVRCSQGFGLFRRDYACKTRMRLVCHKSPGLTVLRGIPKNAYYAGTWHIDLVPSNPWSAAGPPVKRGRLSRRTPRGVRRELAIVTRLLRGPPGTRVLIWARCS
jgi:hypothetical protein